MESKEYKGIAVDIWRQIKYIIWIIHSFNLFENGVTWRKYAFCSLLKVRNWRSSSVFGVPQTLPGIISLFYLENGETHAVTTQTVNHHFSTFRHIKKAMKCLGTSFSFIL